MKLAEALSEKADLTKRIAAQTERAITLARYQEGEEPPENAADLLAETRDLITAQMDLVERINHTNSITTLDDGMTLTSAIALRDALDRDHKLVTDVANAAAGTGKTGSTRYWSMRQLRSELREVVAPGLDVAGLRVAANQIAERRRKLDVRIQQANWAADLLD